MQTLRGRGYLFRPSTPQTNPKGWNPQRVNLDQPRSLQTVHYKTPNCHIAPLMRVYIFGSLGTVVTYFMTHSGSFMCLLHKKKKGKEMCCFHSNVGSFGQPRCDSQSPCVLLGTVLFLVFLEALKLSPRHLPLAPFWRRPNAMSLGLPAR